MQSFLLRKKTLGYSECFFAFFARASCRSIKAQHALADGVGGVGLGTGFAVFPWEFAVECGVSAQEFAVGDDEVAGEAVGGLSSAFPPSGSRVLSKSNKPKGSMKKILQKYKNFQAKIAKSKVFSIALIDKLIYNRICVNIVGKCTQKKEKAFFLVL